MEKKRDLYSCYISTEIGTHTRRCFMTGEYCSQQMNIQRERDRLHGKNMISAFVIMNFSDMSDVVYKWRIRTFVESLSKYLYLDKKNKRLYCYALENDTQIEDKNLEPIEEVTVIRADSDPASNYVICSRICQQMQSSDLVIVDVSSQNPNVFYEFGMAVALGKLILPICYSESFYKMSLPQNLKEKQTSSPGAIKEIEHHIGCYPWRKNLFEYYGIFYKHNCKISKTGYIEYLQATSEKYGFSDMKYSRFPYHEKIDGDMIGELIYNHLRNQYNNAKESENTLVVYTMEGFLNEGQAGRCIVNFYSTITCRMQTEQCFCGERVGVLVQENTIPESDKDAKDQVNLFYNIGEIIHIGVNQATYLAATEKIQAEDVLNPQCLHTNEGCDNITRDNKDSQIIESPTEEQKKSITIFVKNHIRNRGLIIYPNNPVYVERIKGFLHEDLLSEFKKSKKNGQISSENNIRYSFCLFHVMLRSLRYVNEIVVDITNTDNCLQSLFWLGAAHGAGVYAITVKHEITEGERKLLKNFPDEKNRNIFDIAGLWTAIYYTHNTDLFYRQLSMAQIGIERHSKLMLSDLKRYENEILGLLHFNMDSYNQAEHNQKIYQKVDRLLKEKRKQEEHVLESYYRKKFWAQMLRYNHLWLYLSEYDEVSQEDEEPRIRVAKWDFDAVSVLTHYLSKRSAIGEYKVISLRTSEEDPKAETVNFLSIGRLAKPLGTELTENIKDQIDINKNIIYRASNFKTTTVCHKYEGKTAIYKGFVPYKKDGSKDNGNGMFTQHPLSVCSQCASSPASKNDKARNNETSSSRIFPNKGAAECVLMGSSFHTQLAQLILWREEASETYPVRFRVALVGSSGPATLALANLFVEEDTKHFSKKDETENNGIKNTELLCELQCKIRKRLMKLYIEQLEKNMENEIWRIKKEEEEEVVAYHDKQIQKYVSLVKYATSMYLSTVFYRYFLPFLSENDINRITNGIRTFISSMSSARISPFVLQYPLDGDPAFKTCISDRNVENIAQIIPKTVQQVLQLFKGIEAFYKVEVQHINDDKCESAERNTKDIRRIKNIQLLGSDEESIHLFMKQ